MVNQIQIQIQTQAQTQIRIRIRVGCARLLGLPAQQEERRLGAVSRQPSAKGGALLCDELALNWKLTQLTSERSLSMNRVGKLALGRWRSEFVVEQLAKLQCATVMLVNVVVVVVVASFRGALSWIGRIARCRFGAKQSKPNSKQSNAMQCKHAQCPRKRSNVRPPRSASRLSVGAHGDFCAPFRPKFVLIRPCE